MKKQIIFRSKLATVLLLTPICSPLLAAETKEKIDFEHDQIYQDVIAPIFATRCTNCHGEKKQKGKLRLDTPEFINAGVKGDPVIIPGNTAESSVHERIHLPQDDDDVMPPEGKDPLTQEEIKLISWWIEQGAPFDKKFSQVKLTPGLKDIFKQITKSVSQEKETKKEKVVEVPKASEQVVKKLNDKGILVMTLAQNTNLLSAQVTNIAKKFGNKELKLLTQISKQLAWLNLAKSNITDEGLVHLEGMKQLTRLHLENTNITDDGLKHIKNLTELEYLNLYGTKVSDSGLAQLNNLKKLKKIYLWQTNVTPKGTKSFENKIPGIQINLGWDAAKPKKKKNSEVKTEKGDGKPKEAYHPRLPDLSALFDKDSCCEKAHGKEKQCKHACCETTAAKGEICFDCNPSAKSLFRTTKPKKKKNSEVKTKKGDGKPKEA